MSEYCDRCSHVFDELTEESGWTLCTKCTFIDKHVRDMVNLMRMELSHAERCIDEDPEKARAHLGTVMLNADELAKDIKEALIDVHPVDLGWANFWGESPAIVKACREAGHKTTDVDEGPPHRGMKHVVRCTTCNYVYKYDSSD